MSPPATCITPNSPPKKLHGLIRGHKLDATHIGALRWINGSRQWLVSDTEIELAAGPGAGFFDDLARQESGLDGVTLLRSHPLSGERAADLRRRGTGRGTGLTAAEWRAVRAICG